MGVLVDERHQIITTIDARRVSFDLTLMGAGWQREDGLGMSLRFSLLSIAGQDVVISCDAI